MAAAFMILGFGLAIGGIGIWSVPAAMVVAGVLLFVAGGLEIRGAAQQKGSHR